MEGSWEHIEEAAANSLKTAHRITNISSYGFCINEEFTNDSGWDEVAKATNGDADGEQKEGAQDPDECWDFNVVLRRKGICYYVQFQVAISADVLFKLMGK
jgi:hypothetical protein